MYVAKVTWYDAEGDCNFHDSVVILAASSLDKAAADLVSYYGEDIDHMQIYCLEGEEVYDISLNNAALGEAFFNDVRGEDDIDNVF